MLQHKHDPFIYVWGEEGAGKATCCAHGSPKRSTREKAVYIDAAATPLTEAAFEAEYLAIDQIEKLGNEEQALLFAVFNRFRNSGKGFLLLSPNIHPNSSSSAKTCAPAWRTASFTKSNPDRPRKIDALVSMAAARQVTIDPEIFEYLLNHWRRDMDSLMQMLDTLDNYAVTMGKRITLPLLRQLLKQQETQ